MEEINEERHRKRVCLDQAFEGTRYEESQKISQSTFGNLTHPDAAALASIKYFGTLCDSRTASIDYQQAADRSQSTVSSIDGGPSDELTPSTQSEQYTRILETDLDDQVCFGMSEQATWLTKVLKLDNIPILETRVNVQGTTSKLNAVSLLRCPNIEYLERGPVSIAGRLDPHYSKLFKVLNEESCIELQAYIAYDISPALVGRSIKGRGKRVVQAKVSLSVNIYGPMRIYDKVGDFLSRCSDFLQPPLHCDRNVFYRNPQSLFGRNQDPRKTLEISLEISSHIEALSGEKDPSLAFETQNVYAETDPPATIQTQLYSHQKQALSFLLGREAVLQRNYDLGHTSVPIHRSEETIFCNIHDSAQVKGGLLLDSMGLGKSLSIISLIASDWPRSDSRISQGKSTILVAPSSLIRTWEGELNKHVRPQTLRWKMYHGPNRFKDIRDTLSCDLVITTYNVLATEWRHYGRTTTPLFSTSWHRIVLDEGHKIRTSTTLRARSVCALRGEFRWVVTGTPIQNRFEDLASLFKFLNAYPDHNMSSLTRLLRGSTADPEIKRMLASICLRRSKAVINLPARTEEIHKVEFNNLETAAYQRAKDGLIQYLQTEVLLSDNATYSNVLVRINTLRQMCNLGIDYSLHTQRSKGCLTQQVLVQELFDTATSAGLMACAKCGDDWAIEGDDSNAGTTYEVKAQPHMTLCGLLLCPTCSTLAAETSVKDTTICQHEMPCQLWPVQTATDSESPAIFSATSLPVKMRALKTDILALPVADKCVIFSLWTSTLDLIGKTLDEFGLPYERIDGSVPNGQRQQILNSFHNDQHVRALLISLKCGSNGLTLTAANHVFLMEPQWNPMVEDQALDRVYRIGQMKPVTTVRYIVNGTLEESIRHQQSEKRNLAEQALDLTRKNHDWLEVPFATKRLFFEGVLALSHIAKKIANILGFIRSARQQHYVSDGDDIEKARLTLGHELKDAVKAGTGEEYRLGFFVKLAFIRSEMVPCIIEPWTTTSMTQSGT